MEKQFRLIASGHDTQVKSESPYDAAVDYARDHSDFHGMIEIIAPERCFMFMVLRDGKVVNYEG